MHRLVAVGCARGKGKVRAQGEKDISEILAGRRAALILATAGSLLAIALISVVASLDRYMVADWGRRFGARFAVSVGVLFLIASRGGGRLAPSAHRSRSFGVVVGAVFAEVTLVSAALLGSASSLLFERQPLILGVEEGLVTWIAKPVIWATLAGSGPALALGAAFPGLVRLIVRRQKGAARA